MQPLAKLAKGAKKIKPFSRRDAGDAEKYEKEIRSKTDGYADFVSWNHCGSAVTT